jgi:chromosome segregation ATPase
MEVYQMALFKSSNPEKTLLREIDTAMANRQRLSSKLAESEEAITRQATLAKDGAVSGDDAALDAAETSLRAAQDRAATLKTALLDVDQRLVELEQAKAEMADRKMRAETAAEVELLARDLAELAAAFDNAATRLSECTRRVVPLVIDAHGLNNFAGICRSDVPPAVTMLITSLRTYADDVLAGRAPAALPRCAEETSAQVSAPALPPEEPHFTYRPIKAGPPTFKGFVGGKA